MTGTTPSKRRTLAIAASAALAAGTLGAVAAVPASGTQTGTGVRPGSNITVFHNIDFVAVFGYGRPVNRQVTVRVLRRGVVIGSASGPSIDAEGLPGLEVNHGPEGAARPGDCWEGSTPDIKPGDVIRVTDGRGTDQVTVDNIAFTGPPVEAAAGGDIVVPFTALSRQRQRQSRRAFIDSAEFRAAANSPVRFEGPPNIVVEPDGSGTPGAYQMRYPSPFDPSRNDDLNPSTRTSCAPAARSVTGTRSGSATSTRCRASRCCTTASRTRRAPRRAVSRHRTRPTRSPA